MFVTDQYNHRIQKFFFMENSSGKVKKIEWDDEMGIDQWYM
jgi:hypothetical protein